ncbi:MAG: acetyl-CoA carboxylase biotin carboxylase subunit [Chitinophagaceae bacterium]|nr:MAG: acetyl-CoA carboxylase biotin carboxylase subunit [Chitinophagaceae bacterium]
MQKILVANRGEIALRIMRTIRKMGKQCVAVYSDADRNAPHVRFADEAVCLGAAPSADSYLNGDKIIAISKQLGVDGIHPGYGFLSENADFAQKVQDAGISFIGPSPAAMRIMGSKLAAKECVKKYNIPMVPGIDTAIEDVSLAKKTAAEIGYPILIKASAGGGGKGMRVVEREADFEEQMERAVSEAVASFGDGSVFIEKFVTSPRHIEVQVLADTHGNVLHCFERECSIQRRHQKVVEETPSVIVDAALREKIGAAAVLVAKSCNYSSTGTVEFLMDEHLNFYFLEMNTRLQVEHPVTEMITGLDLVEEQINIASGKKLSIAQEDLVINGHAIELRVCAEDPLNNFLPSIGTLTKYEKPAGDHIRVDDGYEQGMPVPIYYDPMIAKLVAHGNTRAAAIQKLLQAIKDYKIEGVATTLPFGTFVLEHEAFVSGNFDTNFVKKHYTPEKIKEKQKNNAAIAAAVALKIWLNKQKVTQPIEHKGTSWKRRLA